MHLIVELWTKTWCEFDNHAIFFQIPIWLIFLMNWIERSISFFAVKKWQNVTKENGSLLAKQLIIVIILNLLACFNNTLSLSG